jgi:uncharacterized protein YjbI with pentapeptide repeats
MKQKLELTELISISREANFKLYPAHVTSMRIIEMVNANSLSFLSYDFSKTDIKSSLFIDCKIYDSIIQNSTMENSLFVNTTFFKSEIDSSEIRNCIFIDCSFLDSNIFSSNISNSIFKNVNFGNVGITQCEFKKTVFENNINIEGASIFENKFLDSIGLQNK